MSTLTGIWVPEDIRGLELEISWFDRSILSSIRNLDKEIGCIATNDYFAKVFTVSIPTITRAIKNLKKNNLVKHAGWHNRNRVLRVNNVLITKLNKELLARVTTTPQIEPEEYFPDEEMPAETENPQPIVKSAVESPSDIATTNNDFTPESNEIIKIQHETPEDFIIEVARRIEQYENSYGIMSLHQKKKIANSLYQNKIDLEYITFYSEKLLFEKGLTNPIGKLYNNLTQPEKLQNYYPSFLKDRELKNRIKNKKKNRNILENNDPPGSKDIIINEIQNLIDNSPFGKSAAAASLAKLGNTLLTE